LQIDMHFEPDKNILKELTISPEVTQMDYYMIQIGELEDFTCHLDCEIVKMETELQIKQAEKVEVLLGEKYMGVDFSRERFKRRTRVYIESEKVEHHLCYLNDEVIGHADFFYYNQITKVEDFERERKCKRNLRNNIFLIIEFTKKAWYNCEDYEI
jgi:hypothetical protein